MKPTRYQHFEKIHLLTFIMHLFLHKITSLKDLMVSSNHKGLPNCEFWVPKLQFCIQTWLNMDLKVGFSRKQLFSSDLLVYFITANRTEMKLRQSLSITRHNLLYLTFFIIDYYELFCLFCLIIGTLNHFMLMCCMVNVTVRLSSKCLTKHTKQ